MKTETILKQVEGTSFQRDLQTTVNVSIDGKSKDVPVGIYNLIVSAAQLRLYKGGLIPHRGWKFTNTKKYFGIKGNRENAHKQIEAYKKHFLPD